MPPATRMTPEQVAAQRAMREQAYAERVGLVITEQPGERSAVKAVGRFFRQSGINRVHKEE